MRLYVTFLWTIVAVCQLIIVIFGYLVVTNPDEIPRLTCSIQTHIDVNLSRSDCLAKYYSTS